MVGCDSAIRRFNANDQRSEALMQPLIWHLCTTSHLRQL
jgi:hypothetical protein